MTGMKDGEIRCGRNWGGGGGGGGEMGRDLQANKKQPGSETDRGQTDTDKVLTDGKTDR